MRSRLLDHLHARRPNKRKAEASNLELLELDSISNFWTCPNPYYRVSWRETRAWICADAGLVIICCHVHCNGNSRGIYNKLGLWAAFLILLTPKQNLVNSEEIYTVSRNSKAENVSQFWTKIRYYARSLDLEKHLPPNFRMMSEKESWPRELASFWINWKFQAMCIIYCQWLAVCLLCMLINPTGFSWKAGLGIIGSWISRTRKLPVG